MSESDARAPNAITRTGQLFQLNQVVVRYPGLLGAGGSVTPAAGGLSKQPAYSAAVASAKRKSRALQIIALAKRNPPKQPVFNLNYAQFLTRLRALVRNSSLLDQRTGPLCGPAAFFFLWIDIAPDDFCRYVLDLHATGRGHIGSYEVVPSEQLLNLGYAGSGTSLASTDWLAMAALRDSSNLVLSYGQDTDLWGGITSPSDIESWMEASGAFERIRSTTTLVGSREPEHTIRLATRVNPRAILLVDRCMLEPPSACASINPGIRETFGDHPNHYAVLMSRFRRSRAGDFNFKRWTDGKTSPNRIVSESELTKRFFGAIEGVPKS